MSLFFQELLGAAAQTRYRRVLLLSSYLIYHRYKRKTKENPEDREDSIFFHHMDNNTEEWQAVKPLLWAYANPDNYPDHLVDPDSLSSNFSESYSTGMAGYMFGHGGQDDSWNLDESSGKSSVIFKFNRCYRRTKRYCWMGQKKSCHLVGMPYFYFHVSYSCLQSLPSNPLPLIRTLTVTHSHMIVISQSQWHSHSHSH